MKEIDFLPDWYKQGRVQQKKHREFYVALGLILFIMTVWSIFANGRVVAARARNTSLQNARLIQTRFEEEYTAVEKERQELKAKDAFLKSIESRIAVSDVIAEITYLLGDKVVLKKLEIRTEPLEKPSRQGGAKAALKTASSPFARDERFKVVLGGFAPDAAEVAEILNRLEQSDYFFRIVPGFSRNANVGEYPANEFEISLYIANYKQN
ncbi:MAG: hypothetical protein PHQ00_01965 [Phycisphaerae bacterium]|nr:hypothetical protein [Phycisphaerae bacterium]